MQQNRAFVAGSSGRGAERRRNHQSVLFGGIGCDPQPKPERGLLAALLRALKLAPLAMAAAKTAKTGSRCIAAIFGLVCTTVSLACSTAAPLAGETGNPLEGRPTDPTPVARYSGHCGLRSASASQFVSDTTPTAETRLRARFYLYTGLTSGTALVYQARNASGTQMIGISYSRSTSQFTFNTRSGSASIGSIAQDRWYSIEFDWNRTATNMVATVRGAGVTTDSVVTVGGVGAGDQIDDARLGWVSGTATASVRGIITDAYESRRTTAIGRLCRGDANNDGQRNSGDQLAVRNEFLVGTLAPAQPDANEDGDINSGDQITVRNLFLEGQGACSVGI